MMCPDKVLRISARLLAVLAATVGMGPLAAGAEDTVLHACVTDGPGTIRMVSVGAACETGQTLYAWKAQVKVQPEEVDAAANDGSLQACVNKSSGAIYIVSSGKDCRNDETRYQWHVHVEKPAKIVFMTRAVYNGDLGGLAGADAKCLSQAKDARLEGSFKAWLAEGDKSPNHSFNKHKLPYVMVGDPPLVVARNFDALVSGLSDLPITRDQFGHELEDVAYWDNTPLEDYAWPGEWDCDKWTSANNTHKGYYRTNDLPWLGDDNEPEWTECYRALHLVCVEQ
jgi:hypothetical protein